MIAKTRKKKTNRWGALYIRTLLADDRDEFHSNCVRIGSNMTKEVIRMIREFNQHHK